MRKVIILILVSAVILGTNAYCDETATKNSVKNLWSKEKAWQWYRKVSPLRGCNYLPRTAVNMTEMWQADTFDPKTIDEELGWAEKAGYNSVRIYLQYLVWKDDPEGLKKRIDEFLTIADKHGISSMLILFCDCAFSGKEPYIGKQDEPVRGVHNSGWVPSPGLKRVTDKAVWPDLEKYVKDIVGSFGNDERVLMWDLYNEPGNSRMGTKSLPLAEAAFRWARATDPSQPLTIGAWAGFQSRMSKRLMELSDIVSFHGYDRVGGIKSKLKICQEYGRPVICTEWLRRGVGNTFAAVLPIFAEHNTGWYNWGLVAGRTQTYMPWGSKKGDPMPKIWQHDIFYPDGKPYDAKEIDLIRNFKFDISKMPTPFSVSKPKEDTRNWRVTNMQNELIKLDVVPEIGGRVIQYSLGDYVFFWVNEQLVDTKPPASGVGPDGEWLNYGGEKLWPAPQGWDNDQQWPGPPDPILDGGAYLANIISEGGRPMGIRLTSQKDQRSGIQFSREIRIADGTTHVSIDATMNNIDTKARRWGIWSVAQLDASNRHGQGHNENFWTYCPLNPNSKFYKGYSVQYGLVNNPSFKPDYENGIMRVHYQRIVGKAGIDSPGGWVAAVNATDGYVFVQRFAYEPDKEYPDDSSVEFWMHGIGDFVAWGKVNRMSEDPKETPYFLESEIISPYATLQPGEEYTFHYDWYSAKIPENSPVTACNDIGVTCEPLAAELKNGQLTLRGKFGLFYRGYMCLQFFDYEKREIETSSAKIPVTPLQSLDLSGLSSQIAGIKVPHRADTVTISIYDEKGQFIGVLSQALIIKQND